MFSSRTFLFLHCALWSASSLTLVVRRPFRLSSSSLVYPIITFLWKIPIVPKTNNRIYDVTSIYLLHRILYINTLYSKYLLTSVVWRLKEGTFNFSRRISRPSTACILFKSGGAIFHCSSRALPFTSEVAFFVWYLQDRSEWSPRCDAREWPFLDWSGILENPKWTRLALNTVCGGALAISLGQT